MGLDLHQCEYSMMNAAQVYDWQEPLLPSQGVGTPCNSSPATCSPYAL
jgi:hypothetical protein